MKKLTYLFLIIGIMNSCGAYPDKNSVMTIEEIGIIESKNSVYVLDKSKDLNFTIKQEQ